jgi:hypothetical protein
MLDDFSGSGGGGDGEPLVSVLEDLRDGGAIDTPLDGDVFLGGFRMRCCIFTDAASIEIVQFGLPTGGLGRGSAGDGGGGE